MNIKNVNFYKDRGFTKLLVLISYTLFRSTYFYKLIILIRNKSYTILFKVRNFIYELRNE
ncbi:hypothetical protein A0H76_1209 [Hepatospora eriocheir]|uniref:Uncharacterized protein n=1 Tax=Hepatospora eriocheir TaxID=1081669 RepID=A0A1X0QHH1_9MICR|nr:hypothetical protein A0H76_1209 [Hepatospora eriocheir]